MKWKKEANDKWVLWRNGIQISKVYQTYNDADEVIYTESETGRTSSDLENLQTVIEDGFNRIAQ
jgi:hypothetical protein